MNAHLRDLLSEGLESLTTPFFLREPSGVHNLLRPLN